MGTETTTSLGPIVVLALGILLIASGNFGVLGALLDKRSSIESRFGRLLRNGVTATVGFAIWIGAVGWGARPGLAFPALIGAMALGSMASLFHQAMVTRKFLPPEAPTDPPSPPA